MTVVADGQQALALLLEGKDFDVILCDLMMPNATGMEVHARLAEARPELLGRVVFLTGGAFTPKALRALVRELVG